MKRIEADCWGAVVALSAMIAMAAACSSKANDPPPEAPVFVLYGPQATTGLTPFPSNRYAKDDPSTATKLRVDLSSATTGDVLLASYASTVTDLNALDGFSTFGGAYVNFSADIDASSLKRPIDGYASTDAPMVLIDVDESSPDKGKASGLIPLYATTADHEYDYSRDDFSAVAQPAKPLRPKTRYLFVVTDRVKTLRGNPVRASEDTVALLSGRTTGAYADSVRAALPILETTGVTRNHVVLATVFTTESVHDELLALSAERRAAPPPAQVGDLTVETKLTPDGHVRFAGKYVSPEYRRDKSIEGGSWKIAAGKPVIQKADQTLDFLLAFSDGTKSGPRPIVIYGHGLGGDKDGTWGTSERLKALNVAVFGIDAPEHGSRSARADHSVGFLTALDFFSVDADKKTFVISRARDNFRQMAADQLELVRFIKSLSTLDVLPVGAPDGVPDLDPSQIIYLGHSFGSVMGATIAALAPEIRAATWNVGGDGLTNLLRDSNTFALLVNALRPVGAPKGDVTRFFAIAQGIIDRGDPINYARNVAIEGLPGITGFRGCDVLLQEVVADAIVPNSTSEALARAAGLAHVGRRLTEIPGLAPLAAPASGNLPSGRTGGIFQFDVADGKPIDHGSLIFSTEARDQYVEFFRSSLAGPKAVIKDPFVK